MSIDRQQIRLSAENSKESLNTDNYIKINIDGSERLLPIGEINNIVNASTRFDFERQKSNFYRILGTINPIVSNSLFNLDDAGPYLDLYTWKGFNYSNQNGDFRFITPLYQNNIKNYLKENDGWFGYYDPDINKSGLCNYFDMEPKRERFSFIPDVKPFHSINAEPVKNWEITITYPATVDSGHTMVNNGLLLIDIKQAVVSTRQMTAISAGCLHNLSVGDLVRITGTNGYDGDHLVVRTGLDNGDLKEYYFVIDIPFLPANSIDFDSRMKKVVNDKEVIYYFRKFRKIKTRNSQIIETNDYETYRVAFSQNSYQDSIVQFIFNEDIDVSNLVDNLNRPLTELYLTIIKTDSNGLFSQIKSGIELPFIAQLNTSNTSNPHLLNIPVINKIHNGSNLPFNSHVPLEENVKINNNNNIIDNNDYYGDLVEYSVAELRETVLAHVSHRFNTFNRETNPNLTFQIVEANLITQSQPLTETINMGPRQEGYFYKAHHIIKIKDISNFIEQGDSNTENIPNYAVRSDDGTYLWRDILDIGFNQTDGTSLNYPFLNGCHYRYDNYCFYVRRQDPFDNWDLYYSKFPSDPIGETITDKFAIKTSENVC